MATETAQFAVDMKDQLSGPAGQAAAALDKLKAKLQAQQEELRALGNAQKVMQGASSVNVADYKKVQDRMKNVREEMAANQNAYVKAGGSLTDLSKKTVKQKEAVKDQGSAIQDLVKKYDKWGVSSEGASTAQNLAAVGAVGAAAAVVALVAIVAAGTIALLSFAIAAADAGRTAILMRIGFAGGAENASALGMHLDQLSRKLPQTRAELNEIAKTLAGEGLKGNTLVDATKAVATTAAAMGSGAASKIQGIITRAQLARRLVIGAFDLQGAGISIDEVAAKLATQMKTTTLAAKQALMSGGVDMKTGLTALNAALDDKFGGTIAKLMTSLPTLWAKAKENIGQLFGGIDIEPLLKGLGSVAHLLDQNTVTGKVLKSVLTDIVQPMVSGLAKAMPQVKSFLIGMAIGAVVVEIVFVKLHTALKKLIPPNLRPDISGTNGAMMAGVVVAAALAGGLATLAVAALLLAAVVALPFVIFGLAIYAAYTVVTTTIAGIKAEFDSIVDAVSAVGSDLADAGSAMIDALVDAIKAGASAVKGAIVGVVKGGLQAAKDAIGMKSPPKAYVDMGKATSDAYAMGVDANADKAVSSVANLVTTPMQGAAGPAGAPGAPGGTRGRPMQVTFGPNSIVINGAGNLDDPALERRLIALFQRVVSSAGLAPA